MIVSLVSNGECCECQLKGCVDMSTITGENKFMWILPSLYMYTNLTFYFYIKEVQSFYIQPNFVVTIQTPFYVSLYYFSILFFLEYKIFTIVYIYFYENYAFIYNISVFIKVSKRCKPKNKYKSFFAFSVFLYSVQIMYQLKRKYCYFLIYI